MDCASGFCGQWRLGSKVRGTAPQIGFLEAFKSGRTRDERFGKAAERGNIGISESDACPSTPAWRSPKRRAAGARLWNARFLQVESLAFKSPATRRNGILEFRFPLQCFPNAVWEARIFWRPEAQFRKAKSGRERGFPSLKFPDLRLQRKPASRIWRARPAL